MKQQRRLEQTDTAKLGNKQPTMDDKQVSADSDVELSDVGSTSGGRSRDSSYAQKGRQERNIREAKSTVDGDGENAGHDEEDDDEDEDDEDSVLQRLTGNYRRFSETQRSRDRMDKFNTFEDDDADGEDDSNVQVLARNLTSQDHDGSFIEEDENEDDDEEEENEDGEEDDDHREEDDDEEEEEEEEEDIDGRDDEEDFPRSTAIRMLANAISGSSRSDGGLSEFENFISGRLQSGFLSNGSGGGDELLGSGNVTRNSSNSNSGSGRSGRAEMTRLLLDHLMPSSTSVRLSNLIDGLNTHKDPYLVMETLNEISNSLLMMTSIQSERQVPTYTLAENLVSVIDEYPEHLELQVAACRCIYNLAEVNYELMYELVSAGVIECLNSKLLDLSYIDMAEQALQALEIISRKAGKQCLNKGSVPIVLTYLDFFTIHTQRKALQVAANASVFIPKAKFDDIATVFPTIKNVATEYTDSQCVESAWIFIANTIKNVYRTPEILTNLIDVDFLKKLCDIFPLCLGNGTKSSGLVTFKTCILLLDSLALLTSYSPEFSDNLLTKCNVGFMITQIFLSYESDDASHSKSSTVTIDALLKCPKELLVTLLKLTCSLIPLDATLIEEQQKADVGNYTLIPEDKKLINMEKIRLVKSNCESFYNFSSEMFPLLLNIYDATVEYKVRRLVLLSVLRMIYMMPPDQLKSIIFKSKITSILASTINHGKNFLQNKSRKAKDSEVFRNYSLIYGSLLIIHSLINRNPLIFLEDFTKEGLISQIEELSLSAEEEYNKTVDNSENSSEESECISNNSDSEDDHPESDGENDNDDDYEHGEDDNHNDDETGTSGDDFETFGESSSVVHRFQFVSLSSIMDDGLKFLSKRSILDSLSFLLNIIISDYETLSASNCVSKSDNMKFLEHFISILRSDLNSISEDRWVEVWTRFASTLDSTVNENSTSSFELISSGIIRELLHTFQKQKNFETPICKTFQYIFCSAMSPCVNERTSPLFFLVKKLEESLDRNESFDIVGSDSDTTQNSRYRAASMTKQMKIKLTPLDPDANEKNKNVLLVVQAIATFESIQNFIKGSKSINLGNNCNLNSSSLDDDYHYEFYIDGEKIPSDATIFGVIYKSFENKGEIGTMKGDLLKQAHTIKYKYVPGKLVPDDSSAFEESVDDALTAVGEESTIETLQLLKILYNINQNVSNPSTSEILFLNYKLSAKLNRQLDEPLLVASGILPDWAIIIPREFPFLFPLDTRLFFLKSTSFGYSRLIDFWSTKSREEDSNSSTRNPMLGRSIRHKLRISRDRIFSSAVKVMENYATNPGLIEIEYFDEVGSGLGPTLEFYSNVSKEFGKLKLYMWRSDKYSQVKSNNELYVHDKHGLFPRPLHKLDPHLNNTLLYFKVLGKFLARSFLDSRIVDFHFNPLFFEIAMKYSVSKNFYYDISESISKIRNVDENLSSSLQHLKLYLDAFADLPEAEWENVRISGCKVSELMLTFVLPGYEEIKLIPGGDEIGVTSSNLEMYINKIIDFTIYDGIKEQINSFVAGFSEIFPFTSMVLFSAEELSRLSGNEVENWSVETLITMIHGDHGYNNKSQQVQWLIEIMSNFDKDERRKFLKFITGSPRLPFDGFKGLSPPFTVVLKHCEDNLKPDNYLPSVMTCANYLKLPCYSSKEVMYAKIVQAMNEGNNSFLLS